MILAGDIGGTKTLLAAFDAGPHGVKMMHEVSYPSQAFDTFREILEDFLGRDHIAPFEAVCVGVAGPVVDGICRATNLPWVLSETDISETAEGAKTKLLNDLESTAYGMLHLDDDSLACLNPPTGEVRPGNIAVIAAGTGLGEAYLYWDGSQHRPIATEGGHSDFAPRTDEEVELLRYMRHELGGRVSNERILSGPGLFSVFRFLRDTDRYPEPAWLAAELADGDPSPTISKAASEKAEPICVAAMNLFCELYGAEAGNMALRALTTGGVYLGGGIAPKNLDFLKNGSFLRGFLDKGRFSKLMQRTPVYVSLNPRTALIGAANYGATL